MNDGMPAVDQRRNRRLNEMSREWRVWAAIWIWVMFLLVAADLIWRFY